MRKRLIKHIVLSATLLFLTVVGVRAAEISAYPLGYCNGEITTNATIKFSEANALVSGAIYIPASYANTVVGNSLTAVKVGIGSTRNITDVSAWIRKDLNGENLASGGPLASINQGWNEIQLSSPLVISQEVANSGFYIGFSFMQSFKSAGLASLTTPSEGGMWVKCGDGEWENHSDEGTLCIEGLVYGDNLPRLNIHLEGVTVDKWYIVDKGILNGVLTVRNLATETVTSLGIEANIDGVANPVTTTADCNIGYNELAKVPFKIEPGYISEDPRTISGRFTVTAVNGSKDEDESDNEASTTFSVIQTAYQRKVLLEEFTTEFCSNCPRVAGFVHDVLADPAYSNVVEALCHHSGFNTDKFTIPADEAYLWFYNSTSVYAPAMMFDRALVKYEDTPVFLPGSAQEIKDKVDQRLENPAVVSVDIDAELVGNSVKVNVWGNVVDKDVFCANPRINVYLVEDNIETEYQAGAGAGFVHQHVTRQVNEIWGDPVVFNNDNTYTYTCELPYSDTYKFKDMKVVAMIYNLNTENPGDCTVENCGSVALSDEAGIEGIEDSSEKPLKIYTVNGQRVDRITAPGIYIVKGKKVYVRN